MHRSCCLFSHIKELQEMAPNLGPRGQSMATVPILLLLLTTGCFVVVVVWLEDQGCLLAMYCSSPANVSQLYFFIVVGSSCVVRQWVGGLRGSIRFNYNAATAASHLSVRPTLQQAHERDIQCRSDSLGGRERERSFLSHPLQST